MQALVDVEMDDTQLIKKHHSRIYVLFTYRYKQNQLNELLCTINITTWPMICGQSIAISMSVCLSAYLSTLAYLKNHTSKFFQIFCTCDMCPWLLWRHWRPVLCTTPCFHLMERMGQNQIRRVYFVQFARCRWRHRGRSLPSPTAFCFTLAV